MEQQLFDNAVILESSSTRSKGADERCTRRGAPDFPLTHPSWRTQDEQVCRVQARNAPSLSRFLMCKHLNCSLAIFIEYLATELCQLKQALSDSIGVHEVARRGHVHASHPMGTDGLKIRRIHRSGSLCTSGRLFDQMGFPAVHSIALQCDPTPSGDIKFHYQREPDSLPELCPHSR